MGRKIGIIVGSLRKGSYSMKVAQEAAKLLPEGFTAEFLDISRLPLYNQQFDDEGNPPESYVDFRNAVRGYDGFLLVTPEHNRSFPAAMKNAMDTGSRPYGQNAWDGKPAAIISVTTGTLGAFGANHHLRQMLTYLNMPAVQQPEVYISRVKERLSPEGALPEDTRALIRSLLEALAQLVEGQPSKPPEEQG